MGPGCGIYVWLATKTRQLMRLTTMIAILAFSQSTMAQSAESLPQLKEFQATKSITNKGSYTVAGLLWGKNPDVSRRLASGAIGCPANEVGISNEESNRGIHTFTAHCRGGEYFCTYNYPAPISCSRMAGTTDADVQDRRLEMTEEMEVWKDEVTERVRKVWVKPSDYDGTRTTVLSVKVDERGRLLNLRWVSRSADSGLDKSVLKAFKQVGRYPIPPDLGAAFKGVEFAFPQPSSNSSSSASDSRQ